MARRSFAVFVDVALPSQSGTRELEELFYSWALRAHEPPIPLEGGYGRALKHNAQKLCAVRLRRTVRRYAAA
jgi:hypothetical protein